VAHSETLWQKDGLVKVNYKLGPRIMDLNKACSLHYDKGILYFTHLLQLLSCYTWVNETRKNDILVISYQLINLFDVLFEV
jgi:hypothetical protein